jgi:hypothetical protein
MARSVAGNFSSGGRKHVIRIFQFCRWLLARSTVARIEEMLALKRWSWSLSSAFGGFADWMDGGVVLIALV